MCHYGVIFHHSVEGIVKQAVSEMKQGGVNIKNKDRYLPIENVSSKLKGGISEHYQVLWHKMDDKLDEENISDKALEWLDKLKTTVSGNPACVFG